MPSHVAATRAQQYATRTLKQFDVDRSGAIDYVGHTHDAKKLSADRAATFARADRNDDGKVGVRELKHFYRHGLRDAK